MKKHYRKHDVCLNCGYTVDKHFCSNCGQENVEPHESFLHFLGHGISHYLHFDSKFFNSAIPLITKPGYLTNEYMAGRRASHLGPLGIYLFVSFIFFMMYGKDILKSNRDKKVARTEQKRLLDSIDTANGRHTKSLAGAIRNNSGTYRPVGVKDTSVEAYNKRQAHLKPSERDNFLKAYFIKKAIENKHDEGHKFFDNVRQNIPKMLFVLLPLFALILKLAFFRSKKYYLEHLIYSMHVHSFLFLFLIVLGLVGELLDLMGFKDVEMLWIALIGITWYIYRSMRTVYKNSRLRTIWKMFILNIAYSILMLISFIAIGLITFITT